MLRYEGKHFINILEKDIEQYLQYLKNTVINEMKFEALNEIEAEIHDAADQYFDGQNQKCRLM